LLQLSLISPISLVTSLVYLILGVEEGSAVFLTFRFECLEWFLASQFFFQCEGSQHSLPDFFDLPVEFLNLSPAGEEETKGKLCPPTSVGGWRDGLFALEKRYSP
jgi:hypothetical protein